MAPRCSHGLIVPIGCTYFAYCYVLLLAATHCYLLLHRPIVPVGTTSARVIESLFWLGAKAGPTSWHATHPTAAAEASGVANLGHLNQWEAYQVAAANAGDAASRLSSVEVLSRLHARATRAGGRLYGSTSLCIAPGYPFALVEGLVTKFHAPDSTLM